MNRIKSGGVQLQASNGMWMSERMFEVFYPSEYKALTTRK